MTITVDEDELLKFINQINQMKNEMKNTQEDMANKHTEEMQDLKKRYDEQKEIRTEINDKLTTKLEENSRLMDDIHQCNSLIETISLVFVRRQTSFNISSCSQFFIFKKIGRFSVLNFP